MATPQDPPSGFHRSQALRRSPPPPPTCLAPEEHDVESSSFEDEVVDENPRARSRDRNKQGDDSIRYPTLPSLSHDKSLNRSRDDLGKRLSDHEDSDMIENQLNKMNITKRRQKEKKRNMEKLVERLMSRMEALEDENRMLKRRLPRPLSGGETSLRRDNGSQGREERHQLPQKPPPPGAPEQRRSKSPLPPPAPPVIPPPPTAEGPRSNTPRPTNRPRTPIPGSRRAESPNRDNRAGRHGDPRDHSPDPRHRLGGYEDLAARFRWQDYYDHVRDRAASRSRTWTSRTPVSSNGYFGGDHASSRKPDTSRLKVEDIGTFDGDNVHYFMKNLEVMSTVYSEQAVVSVLPKAMRAVARDWFVTLSDKDMLFWATLKGWKLLLEETFGDDERRRKEKAEARVFKLGYEKPEKYFYDKLALVRRAEPSISDVYAMREIWLGLKKNAPDLMSMSWKQASLKEFRDELSMRVDLLDDEKKRGPRRRKRSYYSRDGRHRDYGSKYRDNSYRSRHRSPSPKHDTSSNKRLDTKRSGSPSIKDKPSDKGLPPCRTCNEDHFKCECLKLQKNDKSRKSYKISAVDKDASSCSDGDSSATADDSDDESVEKNTYKVTVSKMSFNSFAQRRTVARIRNMRMIEIPRGEGIGEGISWLNGDPLPVEAWLNEPPPKISIILGCGDSGGQCMIRKDILLSEVPDAVIREGKMTPSFTGVGGAKERSLGYTPIPIYLSDSWALKGLKHGRVIKLFIEFQVVEHLDCNFLIGRDATRMYGIDFVESEGVMKIGGTSIPIADQALESKTVCRTVSCNVTAKSDVIIAPGGEALVPVMLSQCFPASRSLLFEPSPFINVSKEILGRFPHAMVNTSIPFLPFTNLCDYPIKIPKGSCIGEVEVLNSNTKASMLPVQHVDQPMSALDRIWMDIEKRSEVPTCHPAQHRYDASSVLCRQEWRDIKRKSDKEKWKLGRDDEILRYLDCKEGNALRSGTSSMMTLKRVDTPKDPDALASDPFGLNDKLPSDDRIVEKVTLDLSETE
ncbi:hypothetical protein DFH27DRAFT_626808 [Peziza echinospora]|nr:hypothetical protein DFH27DRAFT_626808 [Peziza echinospora]